MHLEEGPPPPAQSASPAKQLPWHHWAIGTFFLPIIGLILFIAVPESLREIPLGILCIGFFILLCNSIMAIQTNWYTTGPLAAIGRDIAYVLGWIGIGVLIFSILIVGDLVQPE